MVSKKTGINLLYRDSGLDQTVRKVRRISLIVVGVYIVVLLGMFGATFLGGFLRQNLVQKNDLLSQEVNKYRFQEGLILTVKNRLLLAQTLHSQNKPVSVDAIKQLAHNLSPGLTLRNIQSEEDSKITIFVEASDSLSLANFLQDLRLREFSYLELNNISLTPAGDYSIRLTLR